ncbi:MAG: hypothetical protein U1E73_01025 [Planctomycetota bacterium]
MRVRLWHDVAIFAVALAVFAALPQRVLHGIDSNSFVVWIENHDYAGVARHLAYLRFGGLVYAVLEPFGAGGYRALCVASALGSALGLVLVHRAFALLQPRSTAPIWATLGVGTTAAWFFYATSVEVHGVFAAGAGLAWWMFARWSASPTRARAAALGLAGAAAASLHAFGHLLTPGFAVAAWLLGSLPAPRRRAFAQLGIGAAVHAGAALLLAWLFAADSGAQAHDAAAMLREYAATFAPTSTPAVLWREWLLPYLPWSLLALVALCVPRARRLGGMTLALLLLHLPLVVLLLGYHDIRENGAYLLPIAPAAVWAAAALLPKAAFRAALLASVATAAFYVVPGLRDPVPAGFGQGVLALDREHKVALVVAGEAELDGARSAVKGLMAMDLAAVLNTYLQQPKPLPPFAQFFDGWHALLIAQHMTPLLTARARDFFANTTDPQLRAFWYEHLPQRYRLREVERDGFRGVFVEPR